MDAALIIASGRTGRNSALEPLPEAGLLTGEQRLVLLLQRAGLNKIYVVTHKETRDLEKSLARLGAVFLENPAEEPEMFENICFGLKNLPENCSRVLIAPNHVACLRSDTIIKLLASEADAACAAYQGRGGHPLLLHRKLWPAIMAYRGPGGLAGALRALGLVPEKVASGDPAVLLSLTRDEKLLGKVIREHELGRLRSVTRVALAKEEVFFGPGPQQLLEMVEESSNFREACQKMGISYSKGWKIVERAENALGCSLVERSKGGTERGSSKLSPAGKRLLERYALFRTRSEEAVEAIFRDVFARPLTEEEED